MAQLLGPDQGSRLAYRLVNGDLVSAAGRVATVYAAATGATLASINTYDGTATVGAAIVGSRLTVDAYSQLPLFWFPDSVDTVWVAIGSGARHRVRADYDARIDALAGVVAPSPASSVSAETSYGVSSAVGTSTDYARADHTHGSPSLASSAATDSAVGDSAATGSGTTAARSDHAHGREAFGAVTAQTSYGASSANGSATTLARSDHAHGTVALGTAIPAADAAVGIAGSANAPSKSDHAHPRERWTPLDLGYKTFTCDPAAAGNSTALTAGILQLARVHVPVATTITNIVLGVTAAGTSLTASQCYAALYTAAGAKVDVTGDMSGVWNSTGTKTMPLAGGAYSAAAGDYYIAWWFNGTGTAVAFSRASQQSGSPVNGALVAPNLRFATADTGLTTTAPTSLGSQTSINTSWWAALS